MSAWEGRRNWKGQAERESQSRENGRPAPPYVILLSRVSMAFMVNITCQLKFKTKHKTNHFYVHRDNE